ncbi:hypothetical protein [Halanaerobium congolense]|jgi:hypothetical protein|uniref:Uncharacterized protein n=1 Tax=Halanaerobium congolense TaxID=54121 RepID=A0A4R7EDR1_9FIRM|nr:hypothetical protein [Halanaerobium congolense]TDP25889.1 hypothetical protein C8C79_10551 [Halanaerobium congolense]TDS31577.1 hypothetical protein BY453_11151 [Halanaerobium congolense]
MTASIEKTAKLAGQANDEVQMLFEEWAGEVEKELLVILEDNCQTDSLNNLQIILKWKHFH